MRARKYTSVANQYGRDFSRLLFGNHHVRPEMGTHRYMTPSIEQTLIFQRLDSACVGKLNFHAAQCIPLNMVPIKKIQRWSAGPHSALWVSCTAG
jgi:hypothetical protein